MTGVAGEITRVGRLGIDSDVLIFAVEERHPFHPLAWEVLDRIAGSGVSVVISVVALHEMAIHPLKLGREDVVKEYRLWLREWAGADFVPVDEAVARRASALRAARRMRMGDAFHAATSLQAGARGFLTNDRGFRSVGEMRVFLLEEFV